MRTAVHTKYFVVYQHAQWQEVEQIGKVLPNIGRAVLFKALIIKAINLCDLARLVVTTQYVYPGGVSWF